MMSTQKDKRQHPRKALWYPAKIEFGDGSIKDCQLRDISMSGARLQIGKGEALPERFILVLATIGKPHRRCRIAWRVRTPRRAWNLSPIRSASRFFKGV
jgi:PilZ domain